jgi:two-component system, cell cycle sensor histidine kinase and response regulator CckA
MLTHKTAGSRKRKPASRKAGPAAPKRPTESLPKAHSGGGARSAGADPSFELLFSANPYPMLVFDRDTLGFLAVNAAAAASYGYSRQEFLRMRLTDIRPAEDVPRFLASAREQRKFPKTQTYWRHRRKNGEVFEAQITTQPISFRGREAALVVVQDVTSRRSADRQSAQHAAYLRALTENNPTAILATDAQRRVQMCNPAFERLFGYTLAEVRGRRLESIVALPGREKETLALVEDIARDGSVSAVSKRRRRDGSIIDVRITGVPLVIDGEPQGYFGLYEDITERNRAANAQHIAERRYQRIFENAIEGFFESTPAGKFLTVNPAMARIAGYSSPAEMIAEIYDIGQQLYVDPTMRDEVKRQLEENGELNGFECQMPRKDGSIIWISMNVRALRDAKGKIVSHDGTAEDITERKVAELRRQVSTEIIHAIGSTDNLDELLSVVHDAISKALDAKNCFVALRDPASGLFTFPLFRDKFDPRPEPQGLGRGCAGYVFRTGRPQLISPQRMQDLVEQGEVELQGTASRSWLGVPLRTPNETIGALVVQNYDRENVYTRSDMEFLASVGGQIAFAIERKRAEARLRESEARLRVLIEQLPAVVWTVDVNLRFTSALGAGLARLGLKPDQVVGMQLSEYFETKDPAFLPIAAHHRAIAGEPVTFQLDWRDGSYACHVEPVRDSEGDVNGAICMALDVTDRKRLEEQFRQAQKMEAVGRLAGGIAHDFNNLLMVIQGYADLMADRLPAGESLRRSAEQIQTASRRATSLTQQLLAFSRKQMLAPKVLNIHSVVSDMEKILRRLIGEDVELKTSTERDLWLVKVDRSQVEQVIMNLAVNARDAMPRGGRLTIETANVELDKSGGQPPLVLNSGRYVMLAVTDNGCGMDAATQAHIFEPFYTTKEKGKGTGLGLATVYGIVKQSGGYIWVYSEPGRGTTFKIYLPKIEEEVPGETFDRRPDSSALPRGSEVVLLVEDEKGVRELARQYLEMTGYTVLEAEDGHTALELSGMHSGPIHLLLTDVVMPGISGRELAERISRLRPGIKILYMSGYTDQAVVHHGILENDAVLLQKPFNMGSLASKLREILAAETVQQ